MAHSRAVRTRAVAALLCGQSVGEVARHLSLPRQTVSRYKIQILPGFLAGCGPETRERVAELLLSAIRADLRAISLAKILGNPEYLRGLDVRELVAIYRELSTAPIRMLEMTRAAPR